MVNPWRIAGLLLIAVGLAACAVPKLPLTDVAVIKAPDGSADGMDIYSGRRAAGETVPQLRGNQIIEVRTYLPRIDDFGNEVAGQEIAGASCEAILDTHRATVRTPGGVHVPLYGYVTAPMSLECEMPGFGKSIVVAQPYNKTISDRRASTSAAGAGGGLLGVLVATVIVEGINAASDETNDEFVYAVPPILMRKGAAAATTETAAQIPVDPATPAAQPAVATETAVPAAPRTEVAAKAPDEPRKPRFERDFLCQPWCPK